MLPRTTRHGLLISAAVLGWLLAGGATAEDQVRSSSFGPVTVNNPFALSRAPAGQPRALREVEPPPFDPFEQVEAGFVSVSDQDDRADLEWQHIRLAAAETPKIEFRDQKSKTAPPPAPIPTDCDSPDGCYQAAENLARRAASVEELTSVVQLCEKGLRHEAPNDRAARLRRLAAWAYNRRGELHADAGRDMPAMNDFDAAIESDPTCALAWHNRAISCAQQGRANDALRDFDRVIELNPGLAIAYRNRGELLASLDRIPEAIRDYGRAIVQLPNDAELYKMRGYAFGRLGDHRRAVADLTQSIELARVRGAGRMMADAFTLRGNVQAERGEFLSALRDFQFAVRIDPEYGEAYRSQAWLLATCPDPRFRDPDRAIVAAGRAQQLTDGDDCYVLEALAAAYASDGQYGNAVRCQQQAIAAAPPELSDQLYARLALYERHHPAAHETTSEVRAASHETLVTPHAKMRAN